MGPESPLYWCGMYIYLASALSTWWYVAPEIPEYEEGACPHRPLRRDRIHVGHIERADERAAPKCAGADSLRVVDCRRYQPLSISVLLDNLKKRA